MEIVWLISYLICSFSSDDSSVTGPSNTRTYDSEPPSPIPSRSASEVRAAESVKSKSSDAHVPVEADEDLDEDGGKGGEEGSKKRKKRKNRAKNKLVPEAAAAAGDVVSTSTVPSVAAVASVSSNNVSVGSSKGPVDPAKKTSISNGPPVKKADPNTSPSTTRRPATAPAQPTPARITTQNFSLFQNFF